MASMSPPLSPQATTGRDVRPRAQSALSHTSNRSRRSSGSGPKLDLTEAHSEKKRLQTKANPNVATNELQPAAVAQQEGTLDDLRAMSHKDRFGNPIADPDRSNPTRSRMERPLDTIRSFQDAAEGTSSSRRSSYNRSNSQMGFNGGDNRRSSYYGAPGQQNMSGRARPQAGGGYYRNSNYGFRPDSFIEEGPSASEHFSNRSGMHHTSSPMYYANGQHSPPHSHQQSYETMTSGSEENSKSTNPSSQNSSFDQLHQLRQKDDHGYDGQNGYNGNFSSVSPARQYGAPGPYVGQNGVSGAHGANGMNGMNGMRPQPPLPPQKDNVPNNPRVPIKLDSTQTQADFEAEIRRSTSNVNKRQSWFKRKFSR